MNTVKTQLKLAGQQGVSLVEVLVTLVVGLVLLGGVTSLLIGGKQMNRTHDDVSHMQESGRYALEILSKVIRQAGFRLDPDVNFSGTALTGVNGAGGASDTLTIQYDAQSGGETDCAGTAVAAGLVTSAFRVDRGVNPPTLLCNETVVVDNIEDLQITYGIGDGSGAITAYKAAPTAAEFAQVVAVRISLLVRGTALDTAANKSQTYAYNGVTVTTTDGYLRQIYTTTITARNLAG